jgi:hypothetical protein
MPNVSRQTASEHIAFGDAYYVPPRHTPVHYAGSPS